MIKALLRAAIRGGDPADPEVRRRCGALSGGVGIFLNLLLAVGKLAAGFITSSVAIIADGINNLSDAATSVVTLIGFRIAGQEADADHPFGHGRFEYIAGLVVSLAILLMGLEVGRSALSALFHQEEVLFSPVAMVILCVAIAVKLWLFLFNRVLGRAIDSAAMEAAAADSLSDTLSTGVVLLSALAGQFLHIHVDGLAGLLVAAFILKTGWESVRDTLDPLLGRPMDPDLARDIDEIAVSHENILGIHDLIYHDYGPGRAMMSFHAEVPAEGDILVLHDMIDHVEQELKERHHIDTVIHMDPVVRDERTETTRKRVAELAREIDPSITIHDFRMVPGLTHTNLIFDLVLPYSSTLTENEAGNTMTQKLQNLDPCYCPVIQVERSFVDDRTER